MPSNFQWKRKLGSVLVVSGLVTGGMAVFSPLAQASTGGTLYVNASTGTDSGTCRLSTSPCQTIAYALTQAAVKSTIRVAAGDYPQPLQITQAVTIAGKGKSGSASTATVIDPPSLIADTDANSSNPEDAVIDVNGTTGVNLKDLEISGAEAQGDFSGCGTGFVGVYYHNASGSITGVQVANIELAPDLFGCQQGLGVYVATDTGQTAKVSMSGLNVNKYDKNGVTCDNAGTTCSLTGSSITGVGPTPLIAQNGFQGYGATSVKLSKDTVRRNSYTGGGNGNQATGLLIFDVGTASVMTNTLSSNDVNGYFGSDGGGPTAGTWTISGNAVNTATDKVPGGEADYGWGLQLDSTSNPVSITDNKVLGSAEYGIALTGTSNATVSGNTVNGNGSDGIYVGGPGSNATNSTGNTIENNIANNNKSDGIQADSDSSGNTFSTNTVKTNVRYDLEDAGTGNTWTTNTCSPANDSNPAGLCG
jgi:parallel beta-helix repeat protein